MNYMAILCSVVLRLFLFCHCLRKKRYFHAYVNKLLCLVTFLLISQDIIPHYELPGYFTLQVIFLMSNLQHLTRRYSNAKLLNTSAIDFHALCQLTWWGRSFFVSLFGLIITIFNFRPAPQIYTTYRNFSLQKKCSNIWLHFLFLPAI